MSEGSLSGGAQSPDSSLVRIRAMQTCDVGQAAIWHREEFPRGFYARLGPRFVRAYYRTFVASRHASALVAVSGDGQVVGYLAGTLDAAEHNRHAVFRHLLRLTLVALVCLLRRPGLWRDFVRSRALWYARRVLRLVVAAIRPSAAGRRTGELTYLVCSARFRGRGIGTRLVAEFERQATAAGTSRLTLVTSAGDHRVRAFYESSAWRLTGARWTRDGRELAAFELPITGSQPALEDEPIRATVVLLGRRTRIATVHRSLATTVAITAFAAACTAQADVAHAPARSAGQPAVTPSATPTPAATPTPTTPVVTPPPTEAAAGANAAIVPVGARQWSRMVATGTWRPGCPVTRTGLRRVEVNHFDFTGTVRRGVLVVNADVATDVAQLFTELFEARFPIRRMRPVEEFGGDNTVSLAADNTSAYNCRRASQINAPVLASPHANGRAIDINPYQNPWVDLRCECWQPSAAYGKTRTGPGVITKGSVPWRLFTERGWGLAEHRHA
jgi:ribosomal protein S18 acetylase RimI-like enzyme